MGRGADIAPGHKTPEAEAQKSKRQVVLTPLGEGASPLWVLGEFQARKVSSRRTGGAYSLFEVTTPPGSGPPPHVQHREDEAFYVLEGEFAFLHGEEILRAGAGSYLYVPKGTLHTHDNVGESTGRMLMIQTPGGLYERFFEKVGKPSDGEAGPPVFEDHPDVAGIRATAAEHGLEIPQPDAG